MTKCFALIANLFKPQVILAIFTAWSVSAIITMAGGFPEDSPARTDQRISVVYEAEWIRVPYPGIFMLFPVYHCFPCKRGF